MRAKFLPQVIDFVDPNSPHLFMSMIKVAPNPCIRFCSRQPVILYYQNMYRVSKKKVGLVDFEFLDTVIVYLSNAMI